jgi:hypothetical protein
MPLRNFTTAGLKLRQGAIALLAMVVVALCNTIEAQQAIDPFLAATRTAEPRLASHTMNNADPAYASDVVQTSGYVPVDTGFTPVDIGYGAQASYPGVPVYLPQGNPYDAPCTVWGWEMLPDGLIYRSYQAGPRESRIGLHAIHNDSSRFRSESLWDATLGGRRGIIRRNRLVGSLISRERRLYG